jgi:putative ABC transport system permease protein
MRIGDLILFSFQSFKNRKSRVILTILGVAVGIGVVLFLLSFGYGLQKTLLERITTEDSLLTLDVYSPDVETVFLNKDSASKISALQGVDIVSPQAVIPAQVQLDSLMSETIVNIVDSHFFALSGINLSRGRFFEEQDKSKIVVSPVLAELFNLQASELIGRDVSLTVFMPGRTEERGIERLDSVPVTLSQSFEIIGLTEEAEILNQIYIKAADAEELGLTEYQFIKVKVAGQRLIEDVREELIEMGYLVSALSDIVEQANQVFRVIQTVLGIFGIFSLLVAAIGLVNTMTISLLERVNEIGIMRAIGASSSDIRRIFLIESTLIGLLGGLGGIAIGYSAGKIFNLGLNMLARAMGGQPVDVFFTPFWFIMFIAFFSALVGFMAGIFPAKKASSLNALEALRYK